MTMQVCQWWSGLKMNELKEEKESAEVQAQHFSPPEEKRRG